MNLRAVLRDHRVWFEGLLIAPGATATRFAQSSHVPGRQVAKGVVLVTGAGPFLAVLPATARVDLDKVARAVSQPSVRLASEDEVVAIFHDCERGAVPPFGSIYGLSTLVDASLAGMAEIVCVGNYRHEALRLRFRDFEALTSATRARFATYATSRRHAG